MTQLEQDPVCDPDIDPDHDPLPTWTGLHPSQLPALRSPREVAMDIALWAIWNGYSAPEEGILSGGGYAELILERAGQSFLVNVEVY